MNDPATFGDSCGSDNDSIDDDHDDERGAVVSEVHDSDNGELRGAPCGGTDVPPCGERGVGTEHTPRGLIE